MVATNHLLRTFFSKTAVHLMVRSCRSPGTARTTNLNNQKCLYRWCGRQMCVCISCAYMSVCEHMYVCHTCQVGAPGVPWQEPLKFISVRPSCQSSWQLPPSNPALKWSPRNPREPWTSSDRELGYYGLGWTGTGLGYGKKVGCCSLKVGRENSDWKIDDLSAQIGWEKCWDGSDE